MKNCRRCGGRFTETSWTRDRWLRSICPACILDMVQKLLKLDPEEAAKLTKE